MSMLVDILIGPTHHAQVPINGRAVDPPDKAILMANARRQ